jgi:hypothetical protein
MNVQEYIDHVYDPMDDRQKIETARALASYTDQPRVMDALCETVVNATNHTVREAIIDILKTHNPGGASMRFSDTALWSTNPVSRKWALVSLSLLGCREAKDAVISGLYDPDADVRKAAAMNAGLYADENVKEALEQYMHNHRLDLSLSLIADRLKSIRNRTGLPDEDDDCMMTVLV